MIWRVPKYVPKFCGMRSSEVILHALVFPLLRHFTFSHQNADPSVECAIAEGLALAATHGIDAVLTDYQMPDDNGPAARGGR